MEFAAPDQEYKDPWVLVTSQPTILCSSWQQQPLSISKPRYLEQLENYLRKELLLLDLSTDSAQELRLQVRAHRPTMQGWKETSCIRSE